MISKKHTSSYLFLWIFSLYCSCFYFTESLCMNRGETVEETLEHIRRYNAMPQKLKAYSDSWFKKIDIDTSQAKAIFDEFIDNVTTVFYHRSYKKAEVLNAKKYLSSKLSEHSQRTPENGLVEACLMDLVDYGRMEKKNEDFYFMMKFIFSAWIMEYEVIESSDDIQVFFHNLCMPL